MKNDTQNRKNFDYKSAKLFGYSVVVILSIIFGIIMYFVWQYLIFGANVYKTYPSGQITVKGIIIPDFVYIILLSIVGFIVVLSRICKAIINSITKEKEFDKTDKIDNIIIPIIALLVALFAPYLANYDCVGFNENEIIIPRIFCAEYDNTNVYQLETMFDEFGERYDESQYTVYVFESNGNFYTSPLMNNGGFEEVDFTNQLIKHNLEIKKVKDTEAIPNYTE